MSSSYFTVSFEVSGQVTRHFDREAFYAWLWNRFGQEGLVGVHEGTVLSDEEWPDQEWIVDAGVAPPERDWVGARDHVQGELYFASEQEARDAKAAIEAIASADLTGVVLGDVNEQKPQDWDAEWKATFLNSGEGVYVPPFWRVIPPWSVVNRDIAEIPIKINPGAGFGTGTHETTQICLEAIGLWSQGLASADLQGERVLDFGSGSGILSVALALLGPQVDAVEVDELARDNAVENCMLNWVQDRVKVTANLNEDSLAPYWVIVANILKPVLLEFAEALVKRLQPGGTLILSGLIEKDVEIIIATYSALLRQHTSRIVELGEWRGVIFSPR